MSLAADLRVAARDLLCDCTAFRALVGAADAAAARASVVAIEYDGVAITTPHAVVDGASLRWNRGDSLVTGEASQSVVLVLPIPATPVRSDAAAALWADEVAMSLGEQLPSWGDQRADFLRSIDVEPPVRLDEADELPSWYEIAITLTWWVERA